MTIDFSLLGPAQRQGGFHLDDYWVWCGSVVRGEDGRYHLFASRWPRAFPFHPAWMTHSEVVRASAITPAGPYRFEEVVLPARGPEYWDGDSTHNPCVVRFGDQYLLFYTGSRCPLPLPAAGESFPLSDPRCAVARSNKRVGLATAPSVFGPWTRRDQPILPTRPGTFYSHLTSNPAPVVHEDGSVLLVFKGRPYAGRAHGRMQIGVARAPHWSGPYEVVTPTPIFGANPQETIEDVCAWPSADGYGLIAKDMTGSICGEKHAGIQAFSRNGLDWTICDPPQSWSRRIVWDDGTVQVMGSCERPFLLFEGNQLTHLFLAMADGPGGFQHATRTWNQSIPFRRPLD